VSCAVDGDGDGDRSVRNCVMLAAFLAAVADVKLS
jgi:hypothetical protein